MRRPSPDDIEIWRTVPSFPEIEASSWGRIRRKSHTKPMPHGGIRTYNSEPTYGVYGRAKKNAAAGRMIYRYRGIGTVKVHRLVCEAFHGPAPPGQPLVLHRNEVSTDNRPSNLKWGTQAENLNAPGFVAYCKARFSKGVSAGRRFQAPSQLELF